MSPTISNLTSSPANARAGLSSARRTRSEYLVAVAVGVIGINDVIMAACQADGIPLRTLRLRDLLMARPRTGAATADAHLRHTALALGMSEGSIGGATIGWLIDTRAGGRRLLAWLDGFAERKPPWPGFPSAPPPGRESS